MDSVRLSTLYKFSTSTVEKPVENSHHIWGVENLWKTIYGVWKTYHISIFEIFNLDIFRDVKLLILYLCNILTHI